MADENATQVWRVECDDGVREVEVAPDESGNFDVRSSFHANEMTWPDDTPFRTAVAHFAASCEWPVVSVLAPGQPTRAEFAAELRAEVERIESDAAERCSRMAYAVGADSLLSEARRDLRAVRDELDALRAIVGELPACATCGAVATVAAYAPGDSRRTECCDDHVLPNARTIAYPYADAVRAWRGMR